MQSGTAHETFMRAEKRENTAAEAYLSGARAPGAKFRGARILSKNRGSQVKK